MRVFGYGSLIWKPPPHVEHSVPGYITTHVRRFWQLSEDHRGTPEAPGRVVTLLTRDQWSQIEGDSHEYHPLMKTWGVVYTIKQKYVPEVMAYLGVREINGYTTQNVTVYTHEGERVAMLYVGTPENPQFSPVTDLAKLAKHISMSRGPSGENSEYLHELAQALRRLSPESGDQHVDDLDREVQRLRCHPPSKAPIGALGTSQSV